MKYKLGTLRQVRIQAYFLFCSTLGVLLFYSVAGPGTSTWWHAALSVSVAFWVLSGIAAENRLIGHLRVLEREREEPDSTMEMLCEAAVLYPIGCCVPLNIFLFYWLW